MLPIGIGGNTLPGYYLQSSLRFRSSAGGYLSRTPTSASNRTTWTWSGWVKIGTIATTQILFVGGQDANNYTNIYFTGAASGNLELFTANGGANSGYYYTTSVFRDPSAWYHIVYSVDTTAATKVTIYVNGVAQPLTINTAMSSSYNTWINSANEHRLGRNAGTNTNYFDGYMTEVNFVDGQALTPSDFGETDTTTGVWKPKRYTGTYGTNGFYLPMKETQQATGFNTVLYTGNGGTQSISNVGFSPDLVWVKRRDNSVSYHRLIDSVRGGDKRLASNDTGGETTASTLIQSFDADGYTVGTDTGMNASGDRYVAWCWDAGNDNTTGSELITNGTFDTDTSSWTAVYGTLSASGGKLTVTRTGASFGYAYQAIATTSGKMYAIKFDTEYVAGNGNFVNVGTTSGGYDIGSFGPYTYDVSNSVITFIATGTTTYITLVADTLIGVTAIWDNISVKEVTQDGTILSYYKANPATGFSIVTYTGTGANATVGHGLGVAPSMIIAKARGTPNGIARSWFVYHTTLGASAFTYLDLTNAAVTGNSTVWQGVTPTSTVFSLGTEPSVNWSGSTYVAYCFSEVAGYSKFGSYTGNGSTSGPTITTGFRPAFVMVKRTDSTGNWYIYDNTRNPTDSRNLVIYPNSSNSEFTSGGNNLSFGDTTFQLTGSDVNTNASGGTYIYMAFADTRDAQFNFDASGNKNNWTANNINSNASSETTYDIMNDVATLTDEDTSNFATMNPLDKGSTLTLSEGNLKLTGSSTVQGVTGTFGMSSGKWYFEYYVNSMGSADNAVGLITSQHLDSQRDGATVVYGGLMYQGNTNIRVNGTIVANYASFTTGDTIGIAFDADALSATLYKNGTLQGTVTGLTNPTNYGGSYVVWLFDYVSASTVSLNFGQRPFKYTPPTGYKKLNTYNLPDSTIKDGSQYFNTVTYTGNATYPRTINGFGFQPDFVWFKARSAAYGNFLFDVIRGVGNTKFLATNLTNAEGVNSTNGNINSFDSDGYILDAPSSTDTQNASGLTMVSWAWKAGGTAVSNTDGTITSTVSANTTSGFSVVTYTSGATLPNTVGHGLSQAPEVVIYKVRNYSDEYWLFGWSGQSGYGLKLNTTDAKFVTSGWSTMPTSTVFTHNINASRDYVAYCFHSVEGFSKFGSYTGNGSSDGPFVYTGFRPAFVMYKRTDSTGNWAIHDTARNPYNQMGDYLLANASAAEVGGSVLAIDALSNGFKIRTTQVNQNASGGTYIYMAFAENPFKQSLAR